MKIAEYFAQKYRDHASKITRHEAGAFGIPFPLKKGWMKKHGNAEITDYMREKLAAGESAMQKTRPKKHKMPTRARFAPSGNVTIITMPKPAATSFYETKAWRILRMKVLVKYGAICQCCGASRKTGAVMHVDHIKPRSKFPELELDFNNLQVLCADCNIGKLNIDATDWRDTDDEEYVDPEVSMMLRSF